MSVPDKCANRCPADANNALSDAPTHKCLTDGRIDELTDTMADTPTDAPTDTLAVALIDA